MSKHRIRGEHAPPPKTRRVAAPQAHPGLTPAQLAAAERVLRAHTERLIERLRADHAGEPPQRLQ